MVWAEPKPCGSGTTYQDGSAIFPPGCYVLVNGLRYVCPYLREQRLDICKPKWVGRPLIDVLCDMFRPPPWCGGILPGLAPWGKENGQKSELKGEGGSNQSSRLDEYTRTAWLAHFEAGLVRVRRHKRHREDKVDFEVVFPDEL